jgi:hypothetical protein
MNARARKNAVNRREFLSKTGTGLVAAALPVGAAQWATVPEPASTHEPADVTSRSTVPAVAKKKIPIGVFDPVYANRDLSHLFWQGCDPVEVIHFLAKQGALFHAHMKDTVIYPENAAKYGVLNFSFEAGDLANASDTFRAVGYGHSASLWKSVVQAYMEVGYDGILSIENEDPILTGEVGVERALKNVRKEILGE